MAGAVEAVVEVVEVVEEGLRLSLVEEWAQLYLPC